VSSRVGVVLALGLLAACARGQPADAQIRAGAERCMKLFIASDTRGQLACQPRAYVAQLGGDDAAAAFLDEARRAIDEQGMTIESLEIGEVGRHVTIAEREFAIVPQVNRIRLPDGVVRNTAYLLAIREPHETAWTFVNAAPATPRLLARWYPPTSEAEFSAQLALPAATQPVREKP